MRRVLLLAVAFFVAAIPTLAKDDDAAIRAVLDKYAAAWGSLNPDNAAPLYAKALIDSVTNRTPAGTDAGGGRRENT